MMTDFTDTLFFGKAGENSDAGVGGVAGLCGKNAGERHIMNNACYGRAGRRTFIHGFTLIELMIVVAIIAILAAIAYPSYTSYITRTHRVAAEGCLSEYANYMEQYYTTNLNYNVDALPSLDCESAAQTGDNYRYSFVPDSTSSTTYTVRAVPIDSQLARDTKCGTLTLNQAGTRNTSTGDDTCW